MRKTIDVGSIVGVAEISSLLGVGRTTVSNWDDRRERNGFPQRVKTLASGPIYDVDEIVAWFVDYEPSRGGRPGKVPIKREGAYVAA